MGPSKTQAHVGAMFSLFTSVILVYLPVCLAKNTTDTHTSTHSLIERKEDQKNTICTMHTHINGWTVERCTNIGQSRSFTLVMLFFLFYFYQSLEIWFWPALLYTPCYWSRILNQARLLQSLVLLVLCGYGILKSVIIYCMNYLNIKTHGIKIV